MKARRIAKDIFGALGLLAFLLIAAGAEDLLTLLGM